MPVVPADEVGGAVAAVQFDARDGEGCIPDRPGGEDHGVVMLLQVGQGDVAPVEHVAEQPDLAGVEHIPQRVDDALDARVVGRDAVPHQPVRRGELLEQVDGDVEVPLGLQQDVRSVDAGGSGAHDGEPEFRHRFLLGEVASAGSVQRSTTRSTRRKGQLLRSTIESAKRVRAFLTGPSGSGASASTASRAQR